MPNEKVLKSFESIFVNASEVKWYDHAKYYEVTFVQEDTRASVKFGNDGNFLSSTRYYKEQHLPTNILWKLKQNYAGKTIFGVTELTNSEEVAYFIKLEDSKHWITLKVNGNGQMEVFEKYKKA
jgi:hypothetical protein